VERVGGGMTHNPRVVKPLVTSEWLWPDMDCDCQADNHAGWMVQCGDGKGDPLKQNDSISWNHG
jgi:hypothetical protein